MSWISGLAGKAEDILNKIDQNAANVLQQPTRAITENSDNEKTNNASGEVKVDEMIIGGLKKTLSSSSLSLTKSLTPKKLFRNISPSNSEDRMNGSNLSSRRNSFNSVVADQDVPETPKDPKLSISTKKQEDFNIEKELAAMRIALSAVTTQRDELKEEAAVYQANIVQAKKEIRELENLTSRLASERDEINLELSQLKEDCSEYLKTMGETDAIIAHLRQNIAELTEKLNWQMKETEQVTNELQEYRQKAKSTLQMKDKVIKELKGQRENLPVDLTENDCSKVYSLELESLRQENSNLNDEIKRMAEQLENSKMLVQNLEERLQASQMENLRIRESLEKAHTFGLQHSSQLETDIKLLNEEIRTLRQEISREREHFSKQLYDKEQELVKLRKQTGDVSKFSNPNSMEGRIDSLTQALVKKQTAIETLTAEKNALKLQVEKVEEQLHHLMAQNRQHHNQIVYVNDTDDAKAQLPSLMRENPFDTNVARRMKRAYSSLDSAGIRIGVFLRRYPLVRIMVFIYVAVLHLWVMFVLLSSTPA